MRPADTGSYLASDRPTPAMLPSILALLVALALTPDAPVPDVPVARGPLAATSTPVRDSLTHYYVQRDIPAVRRLEQIARTREDRLLVTYRLFPMTMDRGVIEDIPSEDGVGSARQLALISALWAYRAAHGPKLKLPARGRRSERILDRAREIAPEDPYVLLVRGQSLLYKPGIFGGDVEAAKQTFENLKRVLGRGSVPGLHPFEAEVWIWMCERKLDPEAASAMRQRLLARRPPPMFRQFLVDPP